MRRISRAQRTAICAAALACCNGSDRTVEGAAFAAETKSHAIVSTTAAPMPCRPTLRSYFDTHDLRGGGSRIELTMRQEEDARWGCSHAMAVGNNVVAEARVCLLGKDTAPVINNLLDQIVAKVPQ